MKEIFLAICDRLKTEVPALKWIDFDLGQLDFFEQPPVVFPCALIKIIYPNCDDLSVTTQQVDVAITVRIAFNPLGETNFAAPDAVRNRALSIFDTNEAIHTALQGFETDSFSCLSRKSFTEEPREDGLKVFVYNCESTFEE
jgi:hypothetical protein